jgi:hypothetical protein
MHRSLIALAAFAALLLACSGSSGSSVEADPAPSSLESLGEEGFYRITISERAAQRIGLQTAAVESASDGGQQRLRIPHGAVVYDPEGGAWTYTSSATLVFQREAITVNRVDGDMAWLDSGPANGAMVVSVGAAELYGLEFGIGK